MAAALAAAAPSGCSRRATSTRPAPATRPLEVALSGCAAMTDDGACVAPEGGTIRAFVGATAAARFDGAEGALAAKRVATSDDGALYEIAAGPGTIRVTVDEPAPATEGDLAGPRTAEITLRAEVTPPWLVDARARADAHDEEGALAIDRAHAESRDDLEAAAALRHAARIELARGDVTASEPLFRSAMARDATAGRASDAVDDAMALAFMLAQRSRRYAEARAALDGVDARLDRYPDGRARVPYYRGLIACEAGDRRQGLALFREAARRASRLGLARLARTARTSLASELDRLGRFEDALAVRRAIDRELGEAEQPCDRLIAKSGLGFTLLGLAARRGADPSRLAEATASLEAARAEAACADRYLHATTSGNLALAALLAGRVDEAASALAAARAGVAETPLTEGFFWLDLEGRVALARKAPARALAVYDEMERRAQAALLPEYEWSALVGRGAALEAAGKGDAALEAYARAEDRLDDVERAIPVGEGRARFLFDRERSAAAGIARLVAKGDAATALRWARRAHRRGLGGLEAARRVDCLDAGGRATRDAAIDAYARERAAIDADAALDWKLPVAQLGPARARRAARESAARASLEGALGACGDHAAQAQGALDALPRAPGEVLLAYHPADVGWTGFAADAAGVIAFRVAPWSRDAPPDAIARSLLGPASAAIDRATRLRLVLPGPIAALDVHALPYPHGRAGGALLDGRVVTYDADLPPAAVRAASEARAIVVGDPQRTLPEARREARAAADALGARGDGGASAITVALLEGTSATHAAVTQALEGAAFFHYAGHATFAGEDGWDSALPLAAGGRLLVSDVLALRAPPARVVVSGCEAAAGAERAPGETLGVAQAFLVAGSDVVIAPSRAVGDALSARYVAHLYAALADEPSIDLAEASRRASRALRDAEPSADWASFRALRRE